MSWKTPLLLLLLPALAIAEPRTWTLQKGSGRARFRVEAPLDSIEGSASGLSGELRFDEASWAEGSGKILIDLRGFTTGLSLRDQDLREQFFQVDRFPEAVLSITRLERPSQGLLVPGRDGQADVVGTLSLHGKEQPVRIPVTVQLSEETGHRDLRVTGSLDVAFVEYGIPRPARLFLKLGSVAQVRFEATFRGTPPAGGPVALAAPEPTAVPASARTAPRLELAVVVARRPEKPKGQRAVVDWQFAFTTVEGRGERLFHDPAVGGEQNANSCASCHAWRDERTGLLDALGHVAPNSSVWDSARRPTFWRGFADTVEQATTLCVRRFMLRPGGADPAQLGDLAAYLRRISPNAAAPLDYASLFLTRKTAIDRPTGGDARRGAVLTERHCGGCHAQGSIRPPLEVGLYEPDYLVARVRWIAPHDAKQMPPMPMDRLTDSELRDIVTHLVGTPDRRIFQRKPTVAPRTERGTPAAGPLATAGVSN